MRRYRDVSETAREGLLTTMKNYCRVRSEYLRAAEVFMTRTRVSLGLSKAEMAVKIGISHDQYTTLEAGRSPIRKTHLLATYAVFVRMNAKAGRVIYPIVDDCDHCGTLLRSGELIGIAPDAMCIECVCIGE